MRRPFRVVLCAFGFFLFHCASFALADDYFWRSAAARALTMRDVVFASLVYSAMFGVCFSLLLIVQNRLTVVGLRLGWLLGLFAPLAWLMFVAGGCIPVAVWLFGEFLERGLAATSRESLALLMVMGFFGSILFHYVFFMVLGLFSPRAWGRGLVWFYLLVMFVIVVTNIVNDSTLALVVFLVVCLVPPWIAWQLYTRRLRTIRLKLGIPVDDE